MWYTPNMTHFNQKHFFCTLEGCHSKHYGKGLCKRHYAAIGRRLAGMLPPHLRLQTGQAGTSEEYVAELLRNKGASVERMHYTCPFDLLVNCSIRVEVKVGIRRPSSGTWAFNIHRHGIIKEECDWYVCVLADINTLWVVKAPIKRYQLECGKRKIKLIQEQQDPLSLLLQ